MGESTTANVTVPLAGKPGSGVEGAGYLDGEFKDYSSEVLKGKWYMLLFCLLDFTPV